MSEEVHTRRSSCPISSSLEVLGDRWSLLIVRDMLFAGARTYKDFLNAEEHIATNILANRLARLQQSGVIMADPDPLDRRSSLFSLTEKGKALVPVIMELSSWGTHFEEGRPPEGILEAWRADRAAFIAAVNARLRGE